MSTFPTTENEMLPDYFAAIINELKANPLLMNIVTEVVHRSLGTPEALEHPHRNMVTITGLPGIPLHDGLIMNPFFELRTWGSNGYEAMRVYRLCHSILIPPLGERSGFRRNGCHVYDVKLVNSAITLTDPTGWESRSAMYSAYVREIPYEHS